MQSRAKFDVLLCSQVVQSIGSLTLSLVKDSLSLLVEIKSSVILFFQPKLDVVLHITHLKI